MVQSRTLTGNPLGDPSERALFAYLPPGYDETRQRYPAVYFLPGFTRTGASYLNFEAWEENLQQRMDRLLAQGAVRPMVLVLIDGFTRLGGSQYLNSPATGLYQDYVFELVEHCDAALRTIPRPSARAVIGKSSGGFGALRAAMDRPGTFGLVLDHSGDKYFEMCYGPSLPRFLHACRHHDPYALFLDPWRARPHDQAFYDIMEILAYSACYSPSPRTRFGFDLPLDLDTGEIRTEVWDRWIEHDPIRRVTGRADAFRDLQLLFLDCGTKDEFNMLVGSRLFHRRLEEAGIAHVYEEFDGGHSRTHHRYDVSLAAISRAIEHEA
ncbi:MAG TPA: alpha/beta hydrolase-fold protein [Anaerolineales bacterium]|nr:alpha/beta hydrolase-fold protein [Anaerolineales bacterium]